MNAKLKVLDLFSGIGGFSLGLERTGGFETVAFCEIEPFPRAVLAKHWPGIPCHADVRNLTGVAADVICGGFPCQDISLAGKGAGLAGERSGLWSEFHRLIKEIKPKYAIIENVAALRSRGLDEVLRSLTEIGYDAEWHCIPASAVGAPHRRDRVWVVAHPHDASESASAVNDEAQGLPEPGEVADPYHPRLQRWLRREFQERSGERATGESGSLPDSARELSHRGWTVSGEVGRFEPSNRDWWKSEPGMGRVADGVPNRSHRLKGLGNAIVPQIAEIIGQAILAAESGLVDVQ